MGNLIFAENNCLFAGGSVGISSRVETLEECYKRRRRRTN